MSPEQVLENIRQDLRNEFSKVSPQVKGDEAVSVLREICIKVIQKYEDKGLIAYELSKEEIDNTNKLVEKYMKFFRPKKQEGKVVEEGDKCQTEGCDGEMEFGILENCSCHVNAPCSACVDQKLTCDKCYNEAE